MLPAHIVKHGDTVMKIAAQHKVSMDELKMTNLLVKDWGHLQVGTTLFLPSTYEYVARAGETLDSISKKMGLTLEQLHLFNAWLFPYEPLEAGEHVWVPRSRFRIHLVKRGESLTMIARQNGVPLAELVAMSAPLLPNPSKSDPLAVKPGMKVAIPVR